MNPTLWLTNASPHLRARALWAALFALGALGVGATGTSPPPPTAEGVAAMLGASIGEGGGTVRSEDFVWEARGSFWSDAFVGRRVLFLAHRASTQPADLYRARVRLTRAGHPLSVSEVRNLTRSPLGDDADLVALGQHAAYLTSAFGAVQGATLLDLDGEGDAREARTWAERTAASAESWLTTGSTRGLGRTEITFGAPPLEAREELQSDLLVLALGKDSQPAALDVRDGTLNTGASNAFAAAVQRIPHRAPALGDLAVLAARELVGPGAASGVRGLLETVEAVAGRLRKDRRVAMTMPSSRVPALQAPTEQGWPPPAMTPPIQPALPGEGTWMPGRLPPVGEAPPCFFEAGIRPDPQHPEALVRLVAMDTRQLDLRLAAGVDEPRSEAGLHGSGRLTAAVSTPAPRVVAAFAGGPAERRAASEPGFMVDRRVLVPVAPGLATVAITGDGHVRLGPWGGAGEVPPAFTSVRQTPDALLGWTAPARRPPAGGSEALERSALGLTPAGQLVYAWSGRSTAEVLARALGMAGCTFAVPLAAGPAPAGFAYLDPGEAAAPEMSLPVESLAGRSANDVFFAVLRAGGPPSLASAFAADGGRQPGPAWLPAVQQAAVVSLGAQVHLTAFAPGRLTFRIRAGAREPATKAVAALPTALPEGESARLLAVIGLAAGRRRGARGLIIDGAVGLPFRSEDTGALVVESGRPRILRASEVTPALSGDASELPLTAEDGKLRPEARDVGTMRTRAAACALEDGTFVVAATTFDSDEAATSALLDLGCARVVALDRGTHQAAFVHRAGAGPALEPRDEATALYALEVPLSGRAAPLAP